MSEILHNLVTTFCGLKDLWELKEKLMISKNIFMPILWPNQISIGSCNDFLSLDNNTFPKLVIIKIYDTIYSHFLTNI